MSRTVQVNFKHILPEMQRQLMRTSDRLTIIPRMGETITMVNKYGERISTSRVVNVEHLFHEHIEDEHHVIEITLT